MAANSFLLSYAGIPFFPDAAVAVRMSAPVPPEEDEKQQPPRNQQPLPDLLDELDRIIPSLYLDDFSLPAPFPNKKTGPLAKREDLNKFPCPEIKPGDFYYPTTASRWGVFRGLATSSQAKAMLAATGGTSPATFIMSVLPIAPGNPTSFTVSTSLYMLPPRPLAEHGAGFDGLYLITLVDERFYFLGDPVTLHVTPSTQWRDLVVQLTSALGVGVVPPSISPTYGTPEVDSPLWVNNEPAAVLLDAVAYNIGKVVVRGLDGIYTLQTPSEAQVVVATNRGTALSVVRHAGGDLFNTTTRLNIGDLTATKNSVVPAVTYVGFPKFVNSDPVPHFYDPRDGQNPRPTSWFRDSYGDEFTVSVPLADCGVMATGLVGTSQRTIHDTAKALFPSETTAPDGDPTNLTLLTALAVRLAQDHVEAQLAAALDEVYPGTVAWTPEAIHDIIWTYSLKRRMGSTRVMRQGWTQEVREFQHATPLGAGDTPPTGTGGSNLLGQTVRDSYPGNVSNLLGQTFLEGDLTATFQKVDSFPTQNRWKGVVDLETILFEGTAGNTSVGVVLRGIDGTTAADHNNGATVTWLGPDTIFGVNLTTYEKGQFVFPQEVPSEGGLQGLHVVPQTQTVKVLSDTGTVVNGLTYYPGQVYSWDTSQLGSSQLVPEEDVWVVERNSLPPKTGTLYDGQLAGFSAAPAAPVYAITQNVNTLNNYDFTDVTIIICRTTLYAPPACGGSTIIVPLPVEIQPSGPILITPPTGYPGPYYPPGIYPGYPSPTSPGFIIDTPFLLCDWFFWCYQEVSGPAIDLNTLPLRTVVLKITGGGAVLNNITPATGPDGSKGPQVVYVVNLTGGDLRLEGNIANPGDFVSAFPLFLQNNGAILLWYDPVTDTWYPSVEAGGTNQTATFLTNVDISFDAATCVLTVNKTFGAITFLNGRAQSV